MLQCTIQLALHVHHVALKGPTPIGQKEQTLSDKGSESVKHPGVAFRDVPVQRGHQGGCHQMKGGFPQWLLGIQPKPHTLFRACCMIVSCTTTELPKPMLMALGFEHRRGRSPSAFIDEPMIRPMEGRGDVHNSQQAVMVSSRGTKHRQYLVNYDDPYVSLTREN